MDWLTIRNFGKVKYFNISYYVLFGVPLLSQLYRLFELKIFSKDILFPINLKLSYGASLLYVIGITLYYYCCPKIIKNYEKVEDYIKDFLAIYERAYPDLKLEIVMSNLSDTQKVTSDKLLELQNLTKAGDLSKQDSLNEQIHKLVDSVYIGCVQKYLIKDFETNKNKNKFALYLSAICYILATLILVYLLICSSISVFTN